MHRLGSELSVFSDFSIAYQHVFTRRARRISVPARMRVAPVREVVDIAIAELDLAKGSGVSLGEDRFHAIMIYKGRHFLLRAWHFIIDAWGWMRGRQWPARGKGAIIGYIPLLAAAGAAIELNFQLAERLEGRLLWVFPAYGRTLPRRVRKLHLLPTRKFWRRSQFPALARRLMRADRNPAWSVPEGAGVLALPVPQTGK